LKGFLMLQSRRDFLLGTGAVLALPGIAPFPWERTMLSADAVLLASLTSWELELVREVLANYPALPLAKCIEMLKAFGM
jgi:hypothetical protein